MSAGTHNRTQARAACDRTDQSEGGRARSRSAAAIAGLAGASSVPTTMIQGRRSRGATVAGTICFIIQSCPSPATAGCVSSSSVTPALGRIAADFESRRHAENRESRRAGHPLRHADFTRMEIYTNTPSVKAMREGVWNSCSSIIRSTARFCDPGRRMQVAGIFRGLRQSASRFVEPKVHKPKALTSARAFALERRALHSLFALHPITKDIVGDDALALSIAAATTRSPPIGQGFRQQLHAEHGGTSARSAPHMKIFRFQMRVGS